MTWYCRLFNKDKSTYQEVCLTKDEFDVGLGASTTESSYDVALSSVRWRQAYISRSLFNEQRVLHKFRTVTSESPFDVALLSVPCSVHPSEKRSLWSEKPFAV